MSIEYVYWIFSVAIGLLIGVFGKPREKRAVPALLFLGVTLVGAGVAFSFSSLQSNEPMYGRFIFDRKLAPLLGLLEYRLLALGYSFLIGALILTVRAVVNHKHPTKLG